MGLAPVLLRCRGSEPMSLTSGCKSFLLGCLFATLSGRRVYIISGWGFPQSPFLTFC